MLREPVLSYHLMSWLIVYFTEIKMIIISLMSGLLYIPWMPHWMMAEGKDREKLAYENVWESVIYLLYIKKHE